MYSLVGINYSSLPASLPNHPYIVIKDSVDREWYIFLIVDDLEYKPTAPQCFAARKILSDRILSTTPWLQHCIYSTQATKQELITSIINYSLDWFDLNASIVESWALEQLSTI
ncbi:hypothetical protein [Aquipseudomonas alcaligenes]|uniref:hypothetical protein n=1 Tax=Aquipseudomonas alcaligenes TaxID=43263 RepID=UPI001115A6C9|nr:hypothetical protein [Pseudomonas alcaligenes]